MGKHFTLVIITEKTSRVKKVRVPLNLLIFFIFLAFILIGGTVFVFHDYYSNAGSVLDIDDLKKDYTLRQSKIDEYSKKLSEVDLKIDRLEMIRKKLRDLTSMEVSKETKSLEQKEKSMLSTYYKAEDRSILSVIEDVEVKKLELEFDQNGYKNKLMDFIESNPNIYQNVPSELPAPGMIISAFGFETDPFSSKSYLLRGVTVGTAANTVVSAPADSMVLSVSQDELLGNLVTLFHNGTYKTKLGFLSKVELKSGDILKKGEKIGLVTEGGAFSIPHYYYQVIMNGVALNPVSYHTLPTETLLLRNK